MIRGGLQLASEEVALFIYCQGEAHETSCSIRANVSKSLGVRTFQIRRCRALSRN